MRPAAMLQHYLFYLIFAGECTGQPLTPRSTFLRKRGTPLANNPGAAVVFTIAIVLCLTIIIWAMRKHSQEKYAVGPQTQTQTQTPADKGILEVSFGMRENGSIPG